MTNSRQIGARAMIQHLVYQMEQQQSIAEDFQKNSDIPCELKPRLAELLNQLRDIEAAARGHYIAMGGFEFTLSCRVYPPCSEPHECGSNCGRRVLDIPPDYDANCQ